VPCQAHLVEVRDHYEDIRRQGGDVLVVTFAPPMFLEVYLREHSLPFPIVSDPSRLAYHAFGLERTTWRAMLRPGVMLRVLRLLGRVNRLQRPRKGVDLLQMGGDFILDARRRLVYAHRSAKPTDRPTVGELLAAVRAAANEA
jgi:peroxiredoxin